MPELSILMPVRNGKPFLARAIRSTLGALPRDSELVVYDDGSTDGSYEVCVAVRDRRLRVIRGEGNSGVAAALNNLIDATDSRLVGRMDADDACLPWRFRRQIQVLQAGVDICFTNVMSLSQTGIIGRPDLPGTIRPKAMPLHLLLGNPLVHSTMLGRRQALLDAGGYRALVGAEDYDLWLRCATNGIPIIRLSTPCLLYRRHVSQLSRQAAWQAWAFSADSPVVQSYGLLWGRVFGAPPPPSMARSVMTRHSSRPSVVADLSALRPKIVAAAGRLSAHDRLWLRLRMLGLNGAGRQA